MNIDEDESWKDLWGTKIADPIRICPQCVEQGREGKYVPSVTSHPIFCGICSANKEKP